MQPFLFTREIDIRNKTLSIANMKGRIKFSKAICQLAHIMIMRNENYYDDKNDDSIGADY